MTITTNGTSLLPFPVRFYSLTSPTADSRGRTLASILTWPDSRLESSHDYIQNLFPLPERSPINPSAPVIDEQTFTAFRSSLDLQNQLRSSLGRMLSFYGFEIVATANSSDTNQSIGGNVFHIQPAKNFPSASRNWLTRFDHNHLRITRIIRSCRVLGLETEALTFHSALRRVAEQNQGVLSPKTLMFWRRAAERPLYLAPEDEEDEGGGKEWLYRFEEGKGGSKVDECRGSSQTTLCLE
ncbi:MAG: hypothetical protein Q9182_005319 [Xanthomendoza sp. 2 TL-2023]